MNELTFQLYYILFNELLCSINIQTANIDNRDIAAGISSYLNNCILHLTSSSYKFIDSKQMNKDYLFFVLS